MEVYKFGGASVRSPQGIRNIAKIVSSFKGNLFIVVSAMGKTTNALELVLEAFMKAEKSNALELLTEVEKYHLDIMNELFEGKVNSEEIIKPTLEKLKAIITDSIGDDYDRYYDLIVSYGEIISTRIVSAYLTYAGIENQWLDMRNLLVTDSNFREANVRENLSQRRLKKAVDFKKCKVYLGQGFIGANISGNPTTLGREGSDFTAAMVANLLDAERVTIWKDVPGILNADPRIFPDTVLIPELSYLDAVELAFSGAQIIHPKTIKPIENKNIPLYVKPFDNPLETGSVIKSETLNPIEVPILILRQDQVLVTMRPHDFSFVLEESLSKAFNTMKKHRLKVSLIQSSAISISVCVDNTRYLSGALDELANDFNVNFNDNLVLLTIRGINDEIIQKHTEGKTILLQQQTRRIARFLMRKEEA